MDPTNWLPTYPDVIARRRSRRAPSHEIRPPHAAAVFPVPDLLASLTFAPAFPDRVSHRTTTREQTGVATAALYSTALAPVSWLPAYPSSVPSHRLPPAAVPAGAAPPPGQQVVVAQALTWLSASPMPRPATRVVQLGGSVWPVAPLLSAPCLDFGLELGATPALINESLASPVLIDEGLGTPALITEEFC